MKVLVIGGTGTVGSQVARELLARGAEVFFQENGLKATAADVDRLTKLLGHAPRSFEAFAAETASAWRA